MVYIVYFSSCVWLRLLVAALQVTPTGNGAAFCAARIVHDDDDVVDGNDDADDAPNA